jgi:C-terminal processing protease CtpA/Prc
MSLTQMAKPNNIKSVTLMLLLCTVTMCLISMYMYKTTCVCVSEYFGDYFDNFKTQPIVQNDEKYAEVALTNPKSNLLTGFAEKYLYKSNKGKSMFRLSVKAMLYHLDDPYKVFLNGKEMGQLKRQTNGLHTLEINSESLDLFNNDKVIVSNNV